MRPPGGSGNSASWTAFARHYGRQCMPVPAHPASKRATEASVKVARPDLVPTQANLRAEDASIADPAQMRGSRTKCEMWL